MYRDDIKQKLCPNCQANVEGLVHRCDCCGAPLDKKPSFFIWHTYMTQESGDLQALTKKIFDEKAVPENPDHLDYAQKIIFDIYCYPQDMLGDMTNKVIYYRTKKECRIRIVLDYEKYVTSNSFEKTEMITDGIIAGIELFESRFKK